MRVQSAVALGALVCSLLGGAANADPWTVTVGARGTVTPPYEGADHDIISGSPSISIRRASSNYRYTPPDGGLSIGLASSRYFTVGPILRLQHSRDPVENGLIGFEQVDTAWELGGFVDVWPASWLRGRVEVRRGVAGHEGWVGDAGFDLIANGERWNAAIGPRVGLGDDAYMRTYFGVTPQEAANSPIIQTAYDPGAGARYVGLAASLSHRFSDHWRTTADVGYHRLVGDAGDSPVVAVAGSKDQLSGGLGVYYSFGVGH